MRALIISHQKELYYLYNLETQETVPAKARVNSVSSAPTPKSAIMWNTK